MTAIRDKLFELRDGDYAAFQAKLTPTVAPELFIGVRLPVLRKYATEIEKSEAARTFLETLPHEYYDENLLHSILISRMRSFEDCIAALDRFLPYVDNWAVCDTMRPNIFKKHREALLPVVRRWSASPETYTCRFGLDMLMTYYLDDAFTPELLEIPGSIISDEYYVNMMIAWYFATALAKQWDAAFPWIRDRRLQPWTHNKTIQKAKESFRITEEQKAILNELRVKTTGN